jgi:hypothetical protein
MNKRTLFLAIVVAAISTHTVLAQVSIHSALVLRTTADLLECQPTIFQSRTYADRKSTTLAVLYSIILPGAGEYYAESFSSGKFSLMADAGLWLTYAGFQNHADWVRNDARAFAAQHAGVTVSGQDEPFEVNLGNFLSTVDYNQQQLRDRRFSSMYTASNQQWSWDAEDSRQSFRAMRIRSDEIRNYGKFVIAGLVVNRIFSAFAAARAVNAFNRTLRADLDWQIEAKPITSLFGTHGLEIRLTKEF